MRNKKIIVVDRNPESLKTGMVQNWSDSGTMMGLIELSIAKDLVKGGYYGVSTEQAIFLIPKDSKYFEYK